MNVRSVVVDQFQQVAEEQGMSLGSLQDDMPLVETGLDSLCFAILVSRLESVLGVDPFSSNEAVPFPVNLRDFVRIYEHAAPQPV